MFVAFIFLLLSCISIQAMDSQSQDTPLDCKQMLQLLIEFNRPYAQLKDQQSQNMALLSACNFRKHEAQYEQEDKFLREQLDNLETEFKQQCKLPFKLGENPEAFMIDLLTELNSSCQELVTTYKNTMDLWYHCKTEPEKATHDNNLKDIEAKIKKKRAEFAAEHTLILDEFVVGTDPATHFNGLHIIG